MNWVMPYDENLEINNSSYAFFAFSALTDPLKHPPQSARSRVLQNASPPPQPRLPENTIPPITRLVLPILLDTAHFWSLDFPHIRVNESRPIDPTNGSSGQIFGFD